jgi:hypothetical protein
MLRQTIIIFDSHIVLYLLLYPFTDSQHPAFWGQPMSAEQSFNMHNTFPLPIGASRAEPVSHTQYVTAA